MWKESDFLNHVADAAAQANRVPCRRRLSFDQNLAGRRFQQPIDQFERRRLSRSAAAKQDDRLARFHFERDVLEERTILDGIARAAKLHDSRHAAGVYLME